MPQVRVGRKQYPAYFDERGVLRFEPKRILKAFVDASLDSRQPAPYDLNQLMWDYTSGKYSLQEMIEFYTSIGYSVDGFCDVLDSLLENDPANRGDMPRQMSVKVLP